MRSVPAAAASAVEVIRMLLSIPVSDSMSGFTTRMYAIAAKVVTPARISRPTAVPCWEGRNLKDSLVIWKQQQWLLALAMDLCYVRFAIKL